MRTNMRNGKSVARVYLEGSRSYRQENPQEYPSLNAAKKANGLGATTGKFPPSISEIHETALAEDVSDASQF